MSQTANSSEQSFSSRPVSAFPRFLKQLVFLPFVQYPVLPRTPDLSSPQTFGLSNTDYHKIPVKSTKSKQTLGSWHMKPPDKSGRAVKPPDLSGTAVKPPDLSGTVVKPPEESDTDSPRVILYLHGNAHNRAQSHRVELYKLLQEAGYHVFTIDYRGYGDSSPVELSETTVVEDARTALAWIHQTFQNKPKIFVLGHSLGAAIATHMVAGIHQDMENSPCDAHATSDDINENNADQNASCDAENLTGDTSGPRIAGLILQSPFNKMLDEVMTFSAAKALSSVGVDVEKKLRKGDVVFDSESWLPQVRCSVVIFHAEDDKVIPFRLGKQLFERAKQDGKTDVEFVPIAGDQGCGHKNLYKSTDFLSQLKQFMDSHS